MEANFSEFQFAYFITKEIEDRVYFSNLPLQAPYIPNQVEESAGGYDVSFTGFVSIFLQYKLPIMLTRKNAKEWSDFQREYFRIKIYPDADSHQHNSLVELANRERRNQVFYCAPAFIKDSDLYQFHMTQTVAVNSVFINCYGLQRIVGNDKHNICYTVDPDRSIMYSVPTETKINRGWEGLEDKSQKYEDIKEFVHSISRLHKINIAEDNIKDDLKEISNYFISNGVHMILLKA